MTDEFNYLAQYQPNLSSNNLELIAKAKEFANSAYANNTISAYQKDWKSFKKCCHTENLCPLPCLISTLSLYITYLADNNYKTSSIHRHICAINKIHNMANHILNLKERDFSIVWQGIKRKLGLAKTGKSPILLSHLKQIVKEINGDSNQEIRDRALLLFGWASAMRRSEINALNWTDIQYVEKGILVTIKTSKTDQFSFGQKIAIVYGRNEDTCPVRSLQKWQTISKGNEPIFTY